MSFADRFAGRRAVVTGGASGIGLGVATRLVAEGASVCLWDLDQAALDRAAGELGSQSSAVQVDIADWDAVAARGQDDGGAAGRDRRAGRQRRHHRAEHDAVGIPGR